MMVAVTTCSCRLRSNTVVPKTEPPPLRRVFHAKSSTKCGRQNSGATAASSSSSSSSSSSAARLGIARDKNSSFLAAEKASRHPSSSLLFVAARDDTEEDFTTTTTTGAGRNRKTRRHRCRASSSSSSSSSSPDRGSSSSSSSSGKKKSASSDKSSSRRPKRTEEGNATRRALSRGKNVKRKRLPEPLRFMSGIWDRSFDEENDEENEEEEENREKEKVASKRKQFGYFGALILQISLGAFYCWSLFLVPLELSLNVGRAQLSAIFSLATLFFTLSLSFIVPALISRIRPRTMCILATILATTGVFMASFCSTAMSIFPLYIGFAGLFGIACGLGYGLSQQMSSFAPFGQGLGTGLVTSARAFGAFVYAPMIEKKLDFYGPDVALRNLSYAIAAFGTVASLCFHKASIEIPLGLRRRNKLAVTDLETLRRLTDLRPHTIKMWFVNALGCFAGISVISQAAVLLLSRGDATISANVAAGVMYVSIATTAGRIFGGWLCDRFRAKSVLILAPLIGAAAMFWASSTGNAIGSIVMPLSAIRFALLATGLSYGILQTAVPCEVRRVAGDGDFARAYGRIFTGFCVAGFFGPYVSGILFDAFGTYRVAFQVSGLASLLSSVAATTLKGEAAVLREKRAMELRAVEAAARNDTRYIDCTRTKENEWGSIDT